MKNILSVIFLVLPFVFYAQKEASVNLQSFSKTKYYSQEVAKQHNDKSALSNPDFGVLPMGELEGYVEVLSKRTATERYFVNAENPRQVYISKSSNPFNVLKDGQWRAIDTRLAPQGNGVYAAMAQTAPTVIDVKNKKTSLQGKENAISFNNYYLVKTTQDEKILLLPDWSNYTIGDNGMYITDVFPTIDMEIVVRKGEIESTFILKEKITDCDKIEIVDQFEFEKEALAFTPELGELNGEVNYMGNLILGANLYKIDPVLVTDNTNQESIMIPFVIDNDKHRLTIPLGQEIINNDSLVYPVFVDPTVTYEEGNTNKMGAHDYPQFCSDDLDVTIPGGVTPLDVSVDWEIEIGFQCGHSIHDGSTTHIGNYPGKRSDAAVWLSSDCVSYPQAPTDYWQCDGDPAYCDATSSATAISRTGMGIQYAFGVRDFWGNESTIMYEDLIDFGEDTKTIDAISCFTPACTDQTMNFTLNVSNLDATNHTDCGCDYPFWRYASSSSVPDAKIYNTPEVTLLGWTLKVLAETSEVELEVAEATLEVQGCLPQTLELSPFPTEDGSAYTYLWSTGETTESIEVVDPTVDQTITVEVSNDCGDTETATFNIEVLPDNIDLEFSDKTISVLPCAEDDIVLNPFPSTTPTDLTYLWSNGETTETIVLVPPFDDETLSVEIENLCGITETVNFAIAVEEVSFALPFTDSVIALLPCDDETIELNPFPAETMDDLTFLWSTGETTQTINLEAPFNASTVTVDVQNVCAETQTLTFDVVITNTDFQFAVSDSLITAIPCDVQTLTLDPQTTGAGEGMTYTWSTGATTPTLDFPVPTQDEVVTVTANGLCGETATATFTLKTFQLGVTDTTIVPNTCSTDTIVLNPAPKYGVENYAFLWNSSEVTPTLTLYPPIDEGTVSVLVTDQCGAVKSASFVIDCSADLGVETENLPNQNIKLIPNPASEAVSVQWNAATSGEYSMVIIDALGKEIYHSTQTLTKGAQTININVEHFAKGIYSLLILNKAGSASVKLVVE